MEGGWVSMRVPGGVGCRRRQCYGHRRRPRALPANLRFSPTFSPISLDITHRLGH